MPAFSGVPGPGTPEKAGVSVEMIKYCAEHSIPLFGALAIVGKRIGADIRSIVVIIGINFAFGFALGGVDWRAHLGGLIGGVVAAQLVMNKR